MELVLLFVAFVLYVMLPAWAAETAKIRGLPNRRLFFWMSIGSISASALAVWVIYREMPNPARYPELYLPAQIVLVTVLFWNVLLIACSYGTYPKRERHGFPVLPLPQKPPAESDTIDADSTEVK